jgi:hypothetical protein
LEPETEQGAPHTPTIGVVVVLTIGVVVVDEDVGAFFILGFDCGKPGRFTVFVDTRGGDINTLPLGVIDIVIVVIFVVIIVFPLLLVFVETETSLLVNLVPQPSLQEARNASA